MNFIQLKKLMNFIQLKKFNNNYLILGMCFLLMAIWFNSSKITLMEGPAIPLLVQNNLAIMRVLDFIVHNGDDLETFLFHWNTFYNNFLVFHANTVRSFQNIGNNPWVYPNQIKVLYLSCMQIIPHDYLINFAKDKEPLIRLLECYITYLKEAEIIDLNKIQTCTNLITEIKSTNLITEIKTKL